MSTRPNRPLRHISTGQRVTAVASVMAAAFLLAGAIIGGLARMGVSVGLDHHALIAQHGPLMVSAFFGAVISLERAVAIRHPWALSAPVFAVAGGAGERRER